MASNTGESFRQRVSPSISGSRRPLALERGSAPSWAPPKVLFDAGVGWYIDRSTANLEDALARLRKVRFAAGRRGGDNARHALLPVSLARELTQERRREGVPPSGWKAG